MRARPRACAPRRRDAGEGFGELSILTGSTRNTSAVALEDTLIVKLSVDALNSCVDQMYPNWKRVSGALR